MLTTGKEHGALLKLLRLARMKRLLLKYAEEMESFAALFKLGATMAVDGVLEERGQAGERDGRGVWQGVIADRRAGCVPGR